MSIKAVLFDLDGTLLPMDQDVFVKAYFSSLAKKLAPFGYAPDALIATIWKGIGRMVGNDGGQSNEEAFWQCFLSAYGQKAATDKPIFEAYYHEEFQGVREVCGRAPEAVELLALLRDKKLRVALATNPVFPAIATESRIRWAGLRPEDFELYTTYENSHYCKPNLAYYREVVEALGLLPEECLMVGNDVGEDMVARELGMEVFLLTDCLINTKGQEIQSYPNGDFAALMRFLQECLL